MEGIFWQLLTVPVIFNHTVELKCKILNDDCCYDRVRTWTRNQDVLLFNGHTENGVAKYSEKIEEDGFIIMIHNFSEDDINRNYSCSYGFRKYSNLLPISESELLPNNKTLETYFDVSNDGKLTISVTFNEVYPIPRCTLDIDGTNETLEIMSSMVGLFYAAKFMFNNNQSCKIGFKFSCFVGQNYSFVEDQRCNNDIDATTVDHKLPVILTVSVLLVITLALVVYVYHRKLPTCKRNSLPKTAGENKILKKVYNSAKKQQK